MMNNFITKELLHKDDDDDDDEKDVYFSDQLLFRDKFCTISYLINLREINLIIIIIIIIIIMILHCMVFD